MTAHWRALIVVTLVASIAAGCFAPVQSPDAARIRVVKKVEQCVSIEMKNGEAVPQLELDAKLAAELIAQLEPKELENPSCWYLQQDGSIKLWAGPFCGWRTEAVFERVDAFWRKRYEQRLFTQCDLRG